MRTEIDYNAIGDKTGRPAKDYMVAAREKGFIEGNHLAEGVEPGQIRDWLQQAYNLDKGEAQEIYMVLRREIDAAGDPALQR